ncbi:hypothetical protein PSO31014_02696 [Pandoraea soli]|uniref:Transposase n=1 Tax=Pandoraea soli TaxID=2508293 RepID=A0ABY6W275_9BURK|nr:hypothetical protein PSO31014_02696 [Pandoraea soli]
MCRGARHAHVTGGRTMNNGTQWVPLFMACEAGLAFCLTERVPP